MSDARQEHARRFYGPIAGLLAGLLLGVIFRWPAFVVVGLVFGSLLAARSRKIGPGAIVGWRKSSAAFVCLSAAVLCEAWLLLAFWQKGSERAFLTQASAIDWGSLMGLIIFSIVGGGLSIVAAAKHDRPVRSIGCILAFGLCWSVWVLPTLIK